MLLVCLAGSVLAGCSEPEKKAESTVSVPEEAETAGSVLAEDTASEEVRTEEVSAQTEETPEELPDGTYTAPVEMTGGTGKAHIESPCEITVDGGQPCPAGSIC